MFTLQDMEAMALRGVDENQIDRIIMEFEDHVSKYMDVVTAGEAGFEAATSISEREDRALAALEKELIEEGTTRKKDEEEAELAVIEPLPEEKEKEAEKEPEVSTEPEPEAEPEEGEEEEEDVMLE